MEPLSGKTILVTRPADGGGDDLAAALRLRGANVIVEPAIAFAPPDDPAPLDAAIAELDRYDWLLFTSARGVRAFFDRASDQPPDLELPGIVAVGPKTSAAVRARGATPAIVPLEFSGDAAARAIVAAGTPGDRVLFARAQDGNDAGVDLLRAAGRRVDVVHGYKTVARIDPSIAGAALRADVIAFASGSAAIAVARNVDPAQPEFVAKTIACIGETCARAARAHGFRVDVVAQTSTAEGLAEALVSHFARRGA